MTEPIPGPRALPFVGNLFDIWHDRDIPLRGLERVAEAYGPIYQAMLGGKRRIIVSSAALLEEMTDEKRFSKVPPPQVSSGTGPKGLFTASNDDPDWHQGHRILMPAFAPFSIQSMFPDMKDIANQLILSWARKGAENRILATDDYTRLTLDTIALCTMSFRFNSFYTDGLHPFVQALMAVFTENTARTTRPGFITKLRYNANKEFDEARAFMRKISQDIVTNRRANPTDKPDVLNAMIYGKDPKTGQIMRDELITEQMLTFLIAGHETTSGLLSFATAHLLKHPHTYLRAQKEVDEVIGKRSIEVKDIQNLKYLNAVLRETARLSPTVPVLQKHVNPAIAHEVVTVDNGRYRIEPDDHIILLMSKCQTDAKVWGDNAEDFEPERMLDENFDKVLARYPGAWKPFGNGKRACIGRPFAWQEAVLVLAMILQNFDVQLDDPNYTMKIKQTLTVKPDDLYIRVTPRGQMDATGMDSLLHTNGAATKANETNGAKSHATTNGSSKDSSSKTKESKPISILFGSNTGTCQAFAQRIASDVASRGYAPTIADMDSATGNIPKDKPVIVITSSYEGQPPDNAARFIEWLQECKEGSLTGVEYTVIGCGHRDWTHTFHRIPKLTDELLTKCGAKRLVPSGYIDSAKGNLYGDFDDWVDNSFWPKMSLDQSQDALEPTSNVEVSTNARASSLRCDVKPALVKSNYVLTSNGEPTKRHMEIQLPSDCTYECGDYLAVLPLNSEKRVRRIMNHFGLPWDSVVTIKSDLPSVIPTNVPLSVFDVLRSYVELSEPATKKNIKLLALYAEDSKDQAYLQELAAENDRYDEEISGKRTSLFDILSHHPSVKLPFGEFLTMLPPLHVRQYSISSSPLEMASTCTITYGVIDTAAMSDPEQRYEGVTGNYLQSLTEGDTVQVSVRPSAKKTFRIPVDAEKTPLLMFAAGTGLAPFRGFLQHRSIQMKSNPNRRLARAILFLGCRTQVGDRLYAEQLDQWVKEGVVEVRYAFSKEKEASKGCAYVPDRMLLDAEDIVNIWRSGARGYVCGTRKFAEGIRGAATKIAIQARERLVAEKGEITDEEKAKMESRFKAALQERVARDVFD